MALGTCSTRVTCLLPLFQKAGAPSIIRKPSLTPDCEQLWAQRRPSGHQGAGPGREKGHPNPDRKGDFPGSVKDSSSSTKGSSPPAAWPWRFVVKQDTGSELRADSPCSGVQPSWGAAPTCPSLPGPDSWLPRPLARMLRPWLLVCCSHSWPSPGEVTDTASPGRRWRGPKLRGDPTASSLMLGCVSEEGLPRPALRLREEDLCAPPPREPLCPCPAPQPLSLMSARLFLLSGPQFPHLQNGGRRLEDVDSWPFRSEVTDLTRVLTGFLG